jgi:hypothetical protein
VMARSRAGFFPIRSAFPDLAAGRRPRCSFRGVLQLYACYCLPPLVDFAARFRSARLPEPTARQLSHLTI